MSQPASPMEIYKLLNKSNCRHCNEKTCMAFAAAVFTGKRSLSECPYVDAEAAAAFENENNVAQQSNDNGAEVDDAVEELREQVRQTDLEEAARRLGARFEKGRIIVKVMGKDFAVDGDGRISTQIHVNPWVTVPVFDYIVNAKGTPPTGKWVPLRELKGGREREGLFDQRCTKPLKRIADTYTDFFNDMLDVFDGKRTETRFDADTAVVMYPLAKAPLLFCYWEPEEGMESNLQIFFDKCVEDNLSIGSVYTLGAGLAHMFEKFSLKHTA
ncbi:MAG: DUF3786 domain-containing protein [Desulfosalsimonas sp.]|uniref:DUF3786 domain-containing protein n=1 Tax=Desulfosalsimonas sp. TaxID=3073848 RepID=UPI003970B9D5